MSLDSVFSPELNEVLHDMFVEFCEIGTLTVLKFMLKFTFIVMVSLLNIGVNAISIKLKFHPFNQVLR